MFRSVAALVALVALSGCAFDRRDAEKTLESTFVVKAKDVSDLQYAGTVWIGHDVWLSFSVKAPMVVKDPDTFRKIEALQASDLLRDVPGGDRFFAKGEEPFCILRTDTAIKDLNGVLVVWDKDRRRYLLRSWRHR